MRFYSARNRTQTALCQTLRNSSCVSRCAQCVITQNVNTVQADLRHSSTKENQQDTVGLFVDEADFV